MLAVILGFGLLVFIHEFGHFIIAILFGVKVEKFSIGMGPAIVGFKIKETLYQIGLIPFGGFCQFKEDSLLDDIPMIIKNPDFKAISEKLTNDDIDFFSSMYTQVLPKDLLNDDYSKVNSLIQNDELLQNTIIFTKTDSKYVLNNALNDREKFTLFELIKNNHLELLVYTLKDSVTKENKNKLSKLLSKNYDIKKLRDKDSFFGIESWKRLLIVFAGPFMNYLLAILLFAIIASFSYKEFYLPNKVIITEDIYKSSSAAGRGGIVSGDIIKNIDGTIINSFQDLSEAMVLSTGKKEVTVIIDRNGTILDLIIEPEWDKNNLKPLLGVIYFNEPIIKSNDDFFLIKKLGLLDGDKIISINGETKLISDIAVDTFFSTNFKTLNKGYIDVLRNGSVFTVNLDFMKLSSIEDNQKTFRLSYYYPERIVESKKIIPALISSFNESNRIITMTAIGMHSLIFKPKGNISEQLGGPIKIGYYMKNITEAGFSKSIGEGIRNFLQIVAYISLALAFFNLLPFPALDGGYIILSLFEIITKKTVKLKYIAIINFTGFAILITFALLIAFMDISFLGTVIKK